MREHSALRVRAARRLAALGLIALGSIAAATSPALAGAAGPCGRARQGQDDHPALLLRGARASSTGKADGTVVPAPPQNAARRRPVRDHRGRLQGQPRDALRRSRRRPRSRSASSSRPRPRRPAKGRAALGGNQLLTFHTAPGGDPVVSGGTGRYAGATGGVKMTEVPGTDNTDIVITVNAAQLTLGPGAARARVCPGPCGPARPVAARSARLCAWRTTATSTAPTGTSASRRTRPRPTTPWRASPTTRRS